MLYPFFVAPLVFHQGSSRVVPRVIVNQLVALWAQKHEILRRVDVFRTKKNSAPRAIRPESYDVCYLRKITFSQSHRMFD